MTYCAETVANEFIRLAQLEGRSFTPMQLIKLTYIAHGWTLALREKPLIKDTVEAWMYGPVIPNLYKKLKTFGSSEVNSSIAAYSETIEEEDKDLIQKVYDNYGRLSASQLSNLTHRAGTPWRSVYKNTERFLEIPESLIAQHYIELKASRGGQH